MRLKRAAIFALVSLHFAGCAEQQRNVAAVRDQREAQGDQGGDRSAGLPAMTPAPELFESTADVIWSGGPTGPGVWIAYQIGNNAGPVRITNGSTGRSVDGILVKPGAEVGDVLISSDAAEALDLKLGVETHLRVVALAPVQGPEAADGEAGVMAETDDHPAMPEQPPIGALRAIEQIKGFRSWEPVEMYRAIRDALQESHEYPPEPRLPGGGQPPNQ